MAALAWPVDEEFAMYQRIGAHRIGVAAAKGAAAGWSRIGALARRHGLSAAYVCHGVTAHADDTAAWLRDREFLRDAVRAAADLGAATVYCTSGASGALSWSDAAARVADHLGPVVSEADRHGVHLALENTMSIRSDLSFTHSVADTAELADRIGAGLCVDLYCCWQEAGLLDTVRDHLDRVRLVQVSDFRLGTLTLPNRWVPGDGDVPLADRFADVLALGYVGLVDVELLGPAIDAEGAESALRRGLDWIRARID